MAGRISASTSVHNVREVVITIGSQTVEEREPHDVITVEFIGKDNSHHEVTAFGLDAEHVSIRFGKGE